MTILLLVITHQYEYLVILCYRRCWCFCLVFFFNLQKDPVTKSCLYSLTTGDFRIRVQLQVGIQNRIRNLVAYLIWMEKKILCQTVERLKKIRNLRSKSYEKKTFNSGETILKYIFFLRKHILGKNDSM